VFILLRIRLYESELLRSDGEVGQSYEVPSGFGPSANAGHLPSKTFRCLIVSGEIVFRERLTEGAEAVSVPLRLLRLVVVPGRACFRFGHHALAFDRNCGLGRERHVSAAEPVSSSSGPNSRACDESSHGISDYSWPRLVFTDNCENPLLDYVLPRLVPSANGDGNEIAGVPSALHRCHSAPIWDGT
jgi:hypothetical protein